MSRNAKIALIVVIVLAVLFVLFLPVLAFGLVTDAIVSWLFGKGEGKAAEDPYADLKFIDTAYRRPVEDFLSRFSPEERAVLQPYTPPWSLLLAVDRLVHDPKGKERFSDHESLVDRMLPRSVFLEKENIVETDVCTPIVNPETGEIEGYALEVRVEKKRRRVFVRLDTYLGTFTFRPEEIREERKLGDSECGPLYERRTEWVERLETGPDEPYRPLLRLLAAYGRRNRDDLEQVLEMARTYDPAAILPPFGPNAYAQAIVPGAQAVPDRKMQEMVRAFYDPDRLDLLDELTWPVAGAGTISSPFGMRFHPIKKVWALHTGIDIPAPQGTPVRAAFPGRVESVGYLGGYGLVVLIDHGDGLKSLYAHLASASVQPGERVLAGQTIAAVGSTGLSTGPHLHFEFRLNGTFTDPVAHFALKETIPTLGEGAGGEDHY
ncbi:MAG: hypothetical protein HSCHL_0698 [Hydrogenibacillus schlegelii]|uniref:M23ase beta-sheet core domain-containing protein n=1 Tax=Hydrogenibacillus schlegelii TaxID=1484 RepID=A0A2T5G7S2_HYDSH|nr:M23 family metallopeptidase [Hydrogenibacillus schlegelii]PTQ52227.1 MAG: hypothetical protein HSCHL_0698 [Hydrogenibacillus schlegelii]